MQAKRVMETDRAPRVLCGIEYEYLLADHTGQVLDLDQLDFAALTQILERRPGREDPRLATGDMGIRTGYWYLEGDERFDAEGNFSALIVKGVEIRTPPLAGVQAALDSLLEIEAQLIEPLQRHTLQLGLGSFNPYRAEYAYQPPLNAFERQLRQADREYEGTEVSNLSFGPDINLSFPGWSDERVLAAARRLNRHAPAIIPFSFSSPFLCGQRWSGWSWRTWQRCSCRPAVKVYRDAEEGSPELAVSPLLRPARLAGEAGRIEFKAFDTFLDPWQLRACMHLLTGLCLAEELPGATDDTDVAALRLSARQAFDDPALFREAQHLLDVAEEALVREGLEGATDLQWLRGQLLMRRTPAHRLVTEGAPVRIGGLTQAAVPLFVMQA